MNKYWVLYLLFWDDCTNDHNNNQYLIFSFKNDDTNRIIKYKKDFYEKIVREISQSEISEIINEMEKRLYSDNYRILLGRIILCKPEKKRRNTTYK